MPYSSDQFKHDWEYAIEKDFKSQDGTPATYAAGQPAYYGEEFAKIRLASASYAFSVNVNGTLLAVEQEHNILIYSIHDQSLLHVLRGHLSRVDAIEFHPIEPNKLISCNRGRWGGSVEANATILFWDLAEDPMKNLLNSKTLSNLGQKAVDAVAEGLDVSSFSWKLNEQENETLANDFAKSIETINIKSRVQDDEKLHGRLVCGFGSRPFNHDGSSLIFLPGESPKSNQVDDRWVICIWDTAKKQTKLTLRGHTDSLMWVGFSPDNNMIASVSWDKTFRIWSHADGSLLHVFHSKGQNWTGSFSPDSRFFAGTEASQLFVWDVVHGVEVATHSWTHGWCRHLDWSPSGKQLVVGGEWMGLVFVFDVKTHTVVQERRLCFEKCPENLSGLMRHHLAVYMVRYFDEGRKIAYWTIGDYGVEVYDLETNKKWRFAPGKGGGDFGAGFSILEQARMIVSVDGDAVRFWKFEDSD